MHRRGAAAALVVVLSLVSAACGSETSGTPISIETRTHRDAAACSDAFVTHDLPHLTKGPGSTASTFDGTGAGIAAGDFDGDGDTDLVIPNLSGATQVLENTGDPAAWEPHALVAGRFRGAAAVDLDADDDLDIVLSTGIGPPVLFTNGLAPGETLADDPFERGQIDGVRAATYAFAFSDLGGDGDLDLVTGSYNAELTIIRNTPVLGSDSGVILYERNALGFSPIRMSPDAQALAMALADVDGDDRIDIVVGNDLATADFIWLDSEDGWQPSTPFSTTTYSTMSYDAADLDGDGRTEFFATDMAPLPSESLDDWREVIADMEAAPQPDEVQIPENVLLRAGDDGFANEGAAVGIDATGWSWSGLFGDLDNDGAQDLYVVNGMRSELLFDFLPDARLVEPNQAFRNVDGDFELMPGWDLADTAGGRGAVLFDADGDGDLDIAVNNLDEPARLFENRLCRGAALTVELRQPGSGNTRALGAELSFESDGLRATRTITSTRGYLSAAAPVAHVGLGTVTTVDLTVRWPDGATSTVPDVSGNQHLVITREDRTSSN
ncbi:MAG: CRTAC1 family protein [Actinomycetota bacterium]